MRLPFRIILLTMLIFFVWALSYSEIYYLPRIQSEISNNKQYYAYLIRDLKTVAKYSPFKIKERARNADEILKSHVTMRSASSGLIGSENHKKLYSLFKKYSVWKTSDVHFDGLIKDEDIKKIDTSWLDNIRDFTHWKYTDRETFHSLLKNVSQEGGIKRIRTYRELDTPNFEELRKWAVVHAIQKHLAGKTEEGLTNFRKVAELSFSTNSLVGSLIASSLLKYEHLLIKHFNHSTWAPIDKVNITAFNRAFLAWTGVFSALWLDGFQKEFSEYLKPDLGFCPAIIESNFGGLLYSNYFEKNLFYETDIAKDYLVTRSLLTRYLTWCGMNEFQPFLTQVPPEREKWSKFPILGRLTALYLLRSSPANYFALYMK